MKSRIALPFACFIGSAILASPALAQVTSDNTVNTQVTINDNVAEITGGQTRGSNLFHSFQDFSVSTGEQAFFDNADSISNIFSRVTGGNISNIDGLIRANGSANLFLINPAGIIFSENARLDIGGSFYGSSASSILFEDGEFSAADLENSPLLTVNAPIGLGFRDDPGDIVNQSIATDDTGELFLGLSILEDKTLALLGGEVLIEGGLLTTEGGRIELGSVGDNSTINLTSTEEGFDLSYENVDSFQDISFSTAAAIVATSGSNTTDINIQGRNVSLTENSQVAINPNFEGQAGNITINATDSLILDADTATEVISSKVSGNTIAETSSINIDTSQLTITGGAQIGGANEGGDIRGIDININALDIILENSLVTGGVPAIGSQVFEYGEGEGGNITITTNNLTINDGAQINTATFGAGNGGDITISAAESIELNGTFPDEEINSPSAIFANVGTPYVPISSAGNGGDVTITGSQLTISDGAQIGTTALNNGNGGNLTLNIADSIKLSGTSPNAQLDGEGRSGIFISAEPSYEEFITDLNTGEATLTGEIVTTTGKGGSLTLDTNNLTIESGAVISADTFSLGDGGDASLNVNRIILRDGGRISAGSLLGVIELDTQRGTGGELNITATDSIDITGIGEISGEPVTSSIFSRADSNGTAGSTTLTTNQLSISNGGEINVSATASGGAGILDINADDIDLTQGSITAATNGGNGGIITLDIAKNITLRENSLISASAFRDATGGNLSIHSEFIISFPSQVSGNGNDITANALQGNGGNITITAESLFGIQERNARPQNGTNDIDASSARGADFNGTVNINTPDTSVIQTDLNLPRNLIQTDQTNAQACRSDRESAAKNGLNITGKGGIVPDPALPLNSLNVIANNENATTSTIPAPIETAQGKIQLARGVQVTESGEVILTAYRTNNSGERLPETRNCGRV